MWQLRHSFLTSALDKIEGSCHGFFTPRKEPPVLIGYETVGAAQPVKKKVQR